MVSNNSFKKTEARIQKLRKQLEDAKRKQERLAQEERERAEWMKKSTVFIRRFYPTPINVLEQILIDGLKNETQDTTNSGANDE